MINARNAVARRRQTGPVSLRPDEIILAQAHISNGIFWKTLIVFMLAILVAVFIALNLGVFLGVVALMMLVWNSFIRHVLLMVVTDQRVIVRSGTIMQETVDLRLDRIESVEIQRTLAGYMFGYASVIVTGMGVRLAFVPFIANADRLRVTIDEMLYQRANKPLAVYDVGMG